MRPSSLLPALLAWSIWVPSLPVAAAPDPVAATIASRHVQEAAAPVSARPGWAAPRTVLLLAFDGGWAAHRAAFAAAAPGARIVAAANMAQAMAAAPEAQVIVGFNPGVCDPRLIHRARQLRWIESMAAGVDNCMAVPEIRARALLLTNMRGVDAPVIAEHAIALALALAHGLDTFAVNTEHHRFSLGVADDRPMLQALNGKTLLVVGLGGIGTQVALRAHGLGMTVTATNPGAAAAPDYVSHVGPPAELPALARQADVIVSCVPLTPQTRGMYDAKFFALLKPSALFINVARGGSVVTADLAAALTAHHLAGAGLDVVDPEPLPPDNPLWRAPHVIITPHVSSLSDLPGEERWILAVENLRRYALGAKMLSVVDLDKGY